MRIIGIVFFGLALVVSACGGSVAQSDPDVRLHPRDVTGMPVLWLGDSYDEDGDGVGDLALTGASFHSSPELRNPRDGSIIRPEVNFYSIAYGTCEIPEGEEGGCPVPITVIIEDPCHAAPLATGIVYKEQTMRGAKASYFGEGGLRIETAEFTISVHAVAESQQETEERARLVVENLHGANQEASAYSVGAAFRRVDDGDAITTACE